MQYIVYDKLRFDIDTLCSESSYFKGLKDFPSNEIEQDLTHRGESMLIILNFLTSKTIPEIKNSDIAYQILRLYDELLINDNMLHTHVTNLFEKHLNTCIDMYYIIENFNKEIKNNSNINYNNLTKKQKKSDQYTKKFYKHLEQWNNNKQNYLLDYLYNYEQNNAIFISQLSKITIQSYRYREFDKKKYYYSEQHYNSFIGSYNVVSDEIMHNNMILEKKEYFNSIYNDFIRSYEWINNCYNFDITVSNKFSNDEIYFENNKLVIKNTHILKKLLKNVKNKFKINIYTNYDYSSKYYTSFYEELSNLTCMIIYNNNIPIWYSEKNDDIILVNKENIFNAIKYGNINFLKNYINKISCDKTSNHYCFSAIEYNQIEIFELLKTEGFSIDIKTRYDGSSDSILEMFDLDTIIRLHQYGYIFDNKLCESAFKYKKHDIFKWAFLNNCISDYNKTIITVIYYYPNLDMLKWAHENGCPWDDNTINEIVKIKNPDMLKWAHENGCPWDDKTINEIVKIKNLDMLKWAHENGCPWDDNTINEIVKIKNPDMLKWAHENGCPWDDKTINEIVKIKNIDMLKWAHENGCPLGDITISRIMLFFLDSDTIKWAHENGYPWGDTTIREMYFFYELDILKLAYDNGCPWGDITITYLINENWGIKHNKQDGYEDDIALLIWAHDNACPWGDKLINDKNVNDLPNISKWACDNGCEIYDGYCSGYDYNSEDDYNNENDGCSICGNGGKGDRCCTCSPVRNSYFDNDNYYEREHDNDDQLRRSGD